MKKYRHQNKLLSFFFITVIFSSNFSCGSKNNTSSEKTTNPPITADSVLSHKVINDKFPYSIQIAAMKKLENAEKLIALLNKKHFSGYIVKYRSISGAMIYRIRVGPFSDNLEALRTLAKLKHSGYEDSYIVNQKYEPYEQKIHDNSEKNLVTDRKQLTNGLRCQNPQWSPSGKEIAFYAETPDGDEGIFTIGTGGGTISQVAIGKANRHVTPRFKWSPDGEKVAFVAREVSRSFEQVENLYLVQKNGQQVQQILSQNRIPFSISDIRWALEGKAIAFTANYNTDSDDPDRFTNSIILVLVPGEDPRSIDLSSFGLSTRTVGWKSSTELLFLKESASGNSFHRNNSFTLRIYDLETESESQVSAYDIPTSPTYLFNRHSNQIITLTTLSDPSSTSSYLTRIKAFDLKTGMATILLEENHSETSTAFFNFSQTGDIYIKLDRELWIFSSEGRESTFRFDFPFTEFAISPSGSKLVFTDHKILYSTKISTDKDPR